MKVSHTHGLKHDARFSFRFALFHGSHSDDMLGKAFRDIMSEMFRTSAYQPASISAGYPMLTIAGKNFGFSFPVD